MKEKLSKEEKSLERKALDILIEIDEFRKLVELDNPSGNPQETLFRNPLRPLLDIFERWYRNGDITFSNIKEKLQECSVPIPKDKETLEKLMWQKYHFVIVR